MQEWMRCHARGQRPVDTAGHGKNYFSDMKKVQPLWCTTSIHRKRKCSAMHDPSRNLQTAFTVCHTARITYQAGSWKNWWNN